jgi:hypothetical protein
MRVTPSFFWGNFGDQPFRQPSYEISITWYNSAEHGKWAAEVVRNVFDDRVPGRGKMLTKRAIGKLKQSGCWRT